MAISDIVVPTLPRWVTANPGATDADIDTLAASSPFPLPPDYVALLRAVNGGEAFTAATEHWDDSYLALWPAGDVLRFNAEYGLHEFAPHYFAFGTNGGGELFAFDSRRSGNAVYLVPAIGISDDDDAILFADSFSRFVRSIAAS